MKSFLFYLSFLTSLYASAQGMPKYTTEQFFLDKNMKKVAQKDSSYYTQTNYYQDNKIMTDVNLTVNKMPIEYREYSVVGKDTVANGPWIKWGENSKKIYEKRYENGVIVGKLETFYTDGNPKRIDNYAKDGTLIEGVCLSENGDTANYLAYKVLPAFVQGDVQTYLKNNIEYPKEAKNKKIQGTVEVLVSIAANGTIENTRVLKSPHQLLSQEAERVICAMPTWQAGSLEGVATLMNTTVLVPFEL